MRKIIHVDMDCFFAAIAIKDNPHLIHQAVAVGGRPEKRGVISTCNYIAREFGVRSAMSSAEALKRCPHLILVDSDITRYREVSQQIHEIFYRYTQHVESVSLDEAYLDVSESTLFGGSATFIARHIRRTIHESLGLTASAGIAACKFLAKIASDENKPDGQYVVTPENQDDFVRALALSKIPGVGKVTQQKLEFLGWKTCGDIQQQSSVSKMINLFGVFGKTLWERCHGVDPRPVSMHHQVKSVGIETTVEHDLKSKADCEQVMNMLINKLYKRLDKHRETQKIVKYRVKITFFDFTKTSVEQVVSGWSPHFFYKLMYKGLKRHAGKSVRLLGVGVKLSPPTGQLALPL